jgi:hypothetical protein
LWIRRLDSPIAQPLLGTEDTGFPFWSPDSRWLAFFAGGKLKKIDTHGGLPTILADAPFVYGGSWNPNGTIVFGPNYGALQKISSAGGTVSPATTLNPAAGSTVHAFPWFLPDGDHFVFISEKGAGPSGSFSLVVGSLSSTATKVVGTADSNAIYAEGRLLYGRGGTLMAQPFDAKAQRFTAEAVAVAESFAIPEVLGLFSSSTTGLLAYQTARPAHPFYLRCRLQVPWHMVFRRPEYCVQL